MPSNKAPLNSKFLELINQIFENDPESINKLQNIEYKNGKFINFINKLCDEDSIDSLKMVDMLEKEFAKRENSVSPQLMKDFLLEAKKLKESLKDSKDKIIIPSSAISLGDTIKNIREDATPEKNNNNNKKNI